MRWLFVLGIIVSMVSCTEISFKEPQPKGVKKLKSFPNALRGRYLIVEDSSSKDVDTLIIDKQSYLVTGEAQKEEWINGGYLSDSLVLKKYKGYYFLNFRIENQWVIRPFKQEKNGSLVLYEINLYDDKTVQSVKDKLHPEILKEDSDTFYQVDPKPRELLEFIKAHYRAQPPLQKIK